MTRYTNDFSISRELAERPGVDTRDNPRVKAPGLFDPGAGGAHDESRRMPHLRARGFAPLADGWYKCLILLVPTRRVELRTY